MNRYIVTFTHHSSNSNDSYKVFFYLDSEDINDIKNEAFKKAQNNIDSYSLRNYWKIKEIKKF